LHAAQKQEQANKTLESYLSAVHSAPKSEACLSIGGKGAWWCRFVRLFNELGVAGMLDTARQRVKKYNSLQDSSLKSMLSKLL
jgi:hypothetical protein